MIRISGVPHRITGSGLFPVTRAGHAVSMANAQGEIRVEDESVEQSEESRSPEQAVAATVARMLANPRRVRRN